MTAVTEPLRIVVATGNRGKLAELERLFATVPALELVSLAGLAGVAEVVEDGATFEANAEKKARGYAVATGLPTLADDSGLEVDALGGAPGVLSARYAGKRASDLANNDKLLAALERVPEELRTARFRCVLAFHDPRGPLCDRVHLEQGVVEGRIVRVPRGARGFGYDPLFLPDGYDRTTAELESIEKDRVSHRGAAARRMARFLAAYRRASP